jgi:hypothetical protein
MLGGEPPFHRERSSGWITCMTIDALMRVVYTDLRDLAENPSLLCEGGLILFLRDQMRDSQGLLRQKPSSLFMLGWSSTSVTSLMMQSLFGGQHGSDVHSWMRCPKSILCSATADLLGCSRRICQRCSFSRVSVELTALNRGRCILSAPSIADRPWPTEGN